MMRAIACALLIPIAGCWSGIQGDGQIVEEEVQVEEFHAVSVSDGLPAEIVPGPQRVVLRLDANLVDRVRVVVDDGVLRVEAKDPNVDLDPSEDAVIQISSPTIDGISLSDGSSARATTNAASVSIEISDGSAIDLTTEAAASIDLAAGDGSSATLDGEASELEIVATDGSSVESRIPAQEAAITSRDGSAVTARASERVTVQATDGSSVSIHGNPADRDVEASDGSSVDFVD